MTDRIRFLVVDLGGTQVRTAIADQNGHLVGRHIQPSNNVGPQQIVDQIGHMARRSAEDAAVSLSSLALAVIATPGPVDASTGTVYSAPNMVGWRDEPLEAMVQQQIGVRTRLVNDANAAALGEFTHGSGRGARCLVYMTVSTGVGGGIVIGGRLMEGVSGTAGEVGHMTIDWRGPQCHCGNRGCLEALASGTSIARHFNQAVHAGAVTSYHEKEPATAAQVAELARMGDSLAERVFRNAAEAVGVGVVNVLHLFNPDVVSIGGGVSHAGDLLFEPVREVVNRHAMPRPREAVRIVQATLGENAGLLGAAAVATSIQITGAAPAFP